MSIQSAVRVADRFYDLDPDSLKTQVQFQNLVVGVLIFHLLLMVVFEKLKEWDLAHPRVIHDVDVAFEITPPPPEPLSQLLPKKLQFFRSKSLIKGVNPNPGSEAAPTPASSTKMDTPAVNAPKILPIPTVVPARPVASHRTTVAPPIAMIPRNLIKASPLPLPKEARQPLPKTDVVGVKSDKPLSGDSKPGGAREDGEGGAGTGGQGAGGTGRGQGDVGAGTGEDAAGGIPIITTKLPPPVTRGMGNIAPYKNDVVMRLTQNFHPSRPVDIILLITLAQDGKLLNTEIVQSSGNKKIDKLALSAAKVTQFAPLPEWYKGEQLTFKIALNAVKDADGTQ